VRVCAASTTDVLAIRRYVACAQLGEARLAGFGRELPFKPRQQIALNRPLELIAQQFTTKLAPIAPLPAGGA